MSTAEFTKMGLDALSHGQYDAAINMLRHALGNDQNDLPARFGLAEALHRRGNLTEAIYEYQTVLRIEPDHPKALPQLAEVYLLSGKPRQALNNLDIALRATPGDPDLLIAHGMALLELGRHHTALADFHSASRLRPGNGMIHHMIALCYRAEKDSEGERRALEQLLRITPHSLACLNDLGRLDMLDGDYHAARDYFGRALQVAPTSPTALANRAIALTVLDDETAPDAWEKALAADEIAPPDGVRTAAIAQLHGLAQDLFNAEANADTAGQRQYLANGALTMSTIV
ncbi:lipopolysaccharide assembly protein LapB [Thalassospira profundimaris]|uniref:tetratricopeptide repeat protein n=1 Tax=Thalassospira profundimaris TaxID=502049 RepID=UPI000DEDD514|nr:tetratricopeptide repeat protein [Thalassospira profundimaris]